MKGTRVTYRYAKSLLQLAAERNELEVVHTDMQLVASTTDESRDLSLLLKSPLVKTDKKQSILKAIFAGKLSALSDGFINIITAKKRESLLEGIAEDFIRQYKVLKSITVAEITTAVALDEALKNKIIGLLPDGIKGDTVQVKENINPEIIGGYIVRMGDIQIDNSIARRLNNLKGEFDDNLYVAEI